MWHRPIRPAHSSAALASRPVDGGALWVLVRFRVQKRIFGEHRK
jgi:hypothetical protein